MSKRADRGYSSFWRRATVITLPPLIHGLMKRDWHGQEHIPPEGGVIVAANHMSYVDWAAVALFVYESGRYPAFLIKSTVFDVKLVGSFLRACGQFPVRRGHADAALVLKDAERGVRNGECLVFYPEGTATRDPAMWPMVAKTGVARLALSTGAPVIPIAHWGSQNILPYRTAQLHVAPRRTVSMLAGQPVDLTAFMGQPLNREVLREATAAIMSDITALVARLRGEEPPAVPYDLAATRRAAHQARSGAPGEQAERGETARAQAERPGGPPERAGGDGGEATGEGAPRGAAPA